MLRGARRRLGGLRVELRAPDDGDPPGRGRPATRRETARARTIFSERFLIQPAAAAGAEPDPAGPPVLLIDELDRADEPFEAFLLEVLSRLPDHDPRARHDQRAERRRSSIITSNRTREIHDALKRRCFYHWVDYPDAERELEILQRQGAGRRRARCRARSSRFVQRLRAMDLFKLPGVAETIDWAKALVALDAIALDPATINDTLGVLLKYQDDIAQHAAAPRPAQLLAAGRRRAGGARR